MTALAAPSGRLLLVNAHLIDGVRPDVVGGASVLVEDGRITGVTGGPPAADHRT